MRLSSFLLVLTMVATGRAAADAARAPGSFVRYRVLSAQTGAPPPFNCVQIAYGPSAPTGTACQLTVWENVDPNAKPLFHLRLITSGDLLAETAGPVDILRYQLAIGETNEVLEYRNARTGKALLPGWDNFVRDFLPRPCGTGLPPGACGGRDAAGFPNTCEYLGHVLTLERSGTNADWRDWPDTKLLVLDPELLIGTSRTIKDKQGHRLPQKPDRQDYHYVPLSKEDYRTLVDAGMNLFCVGPDQEAYVRDEPVFYLRSIAGKTPFHYPADLYRSNYAGNDMFIDEPTCIMVGDKRINVTLKHFSDAATVLTKRVRTAYLGTEGAAYGLDRELRGRGIALGDMRLVNLDIPTWETQYETAYYQMAGGVAGIVHEGRYQLEAFNTMAKASTGIERTCTAEELLRYHYAFLRGAARRFGKVWGTSIYGQADPALSPTALRMAYDMGARYLWYWTSDHDHHLPWPEQLELTQVIRRHAAERPRPSIRGARPTLDKLILIPYGYFLTLESSTHRKESGDLWWVREMDAEGKNEASQRYRRLMRNAFVEIIKSFEAREDFDICVDDGEVATGYRQVVRVNDR